MVRPSSKILAAAGVLLVVAAVAWLARGAAAFQPDYWLALVQSHPVTSPALFVPAYALAVTVLLPTLPLNLVAGALWGPVFGGTLALAGSVSGAMLAFLVARGTFGQPLARRVDARFIKWLQAEFLRHGWKVVAFVRLNPIFPGPVNFLFGFTSIPFRTYCWATMVFLIPPTVAFAIVGHSIGQLVLRGHVEDLRHTLLIAGASILALALSAMGLRVGYVFRRQELSDTGH